METLPPPDFSTSLPLVKKGIDDYLYGTLTKRIIGTAIEVHKQLGPGFLESIYEEAFSHELDRQQLKHHRQVPIRIRYRGFAIGMHRLDIVVEDKVVVELKATKAIEDVHVAIALSYLKASGLKVGLIINFSETKIRVRRVYCGIPIQEIKSD